MPNDTRDTVTLMQIRERIGNGSQILPDDLADASRETLIQLVIELSELLDFKVTP